MFTSNTVITKIKILKVNKTLKLQPEIAVKVAKSSIY